jgi:uncharacterized protein YlxW (UPF0749 family)
VPLTGPGLVLQLEDSGVYVGEGSAGRDALVTAEDVRTVVEELWLAGAQAIAVNRERVTGATAFVDIGGSVLVNSAYLAPPYQITAIGDDDMLERLTQLPGFVDFMRARAETFGIGVSFADPDEVDVPAYAGGVNLRFTRVLQPTTPASGGE